MTNDYTTIATAIYQQTQLVDLAKPENVGPFQKLVLSALEEAHRNGLQEAATPDLFESYGGSE